MAARVGVDFAVLSSLISFSYLLIFQLTLNDVEFAKASASYSVFAHRGVFIADAHQEISLLHQHLLVQVLLQAFAHTGQIVLGSCASRCNLLPAVTGDDLRRVSYVVVHTFIFLFIVILHQVKPLIELGALGLHQLGLLAV